MSSKYDDLSREELLKLLQARDKRDATKFGLVWEANEIERDRAVNQDFVALDLDAELSEGEAPYRNLIIEGDNFDALRHLRMCYAGRVKCIFIDPPYNTGQSDFVYNDRFVDKEDLWKHSKWCEFLYQRLLLARDLLTQDGVLFCCINDKNRAKLELLIEKVFPGRFVGSFIWRTRSGANDSKEYFRSINHEHVLCFANPDFSFEGTRKSTEAYTNPDKDPRGPWNNDNLVQPKTLKQRAKGFYPIKDPETKIWYPCDPDNVWRFSSEKRLKAGQTLRTKPMEQIIREGKVLWPQEDQTVCYETKAQLVEAVQDGTAPRNLRLGTTPEEQAFWDAELDFWVGKTMGYGKPRYKRHLSELKRSEKPFSTWLMPASLKKAERAELDL
ncbi:MAG TPA: site-specific DNA-methyltransferase, partial [Opitutales bacterium]|nr:site-specific DNA-methyltransferase [Opitutales bacterium]